MEKVKQNFVIMVDNGKVHSRWDSDQLSFVGAIIGDIIGSSYELKGTRIKSTEFDLFPPRATYTDDTVMTIAVAKWLSRLNHIPSNEEGLIDIMKDFGMRYMDVGYGHSFKQWIITCNYLTNKLHYNIIEVIKKVKVIF